MYSEQEGAFNNVECIKLMNNRNIKHIMVVDGAHTIERFIRTSKEHTHTIVNAMGWDRDNWVSQLEPVLHKYNNSEHKSTHMSPNQTKKACNTCMVSFNVWHNAKRNRRHPDLQIGDEVRVMIKKDNTINDICKHWQPTNIK